MLFYVVDIKLGKIIQMNEYASKTKDNKVYRGKIIFPENDPHSHRDITMDDVFLTTGCQSGAFEVSQSLDTIKMDEIRERAQRLDRLMKKRLKEIPNGYKAYNWQIT